MSDGIRIGDNEIFYDELVRRPELWSVLVAESGRLWEENAALHIALFHVENGLAHPDERIRALIRAALAAKEAGT